MTMPIIFGAYLLGSIPFGWIVARAVGGFDIRSRGSGNIGATNVGRMIGRKWGAFVFAFDVAKGLAPAWVGMAAGARDVAVLAGLAAIAGHNWPIFLGFAGGKGVATTCGVVACVFPLGLLTSLASWLIAVGLWRYVSLASMLAGVALFVSAIAIQPDPFGSDRMVTAFAALAAVLTLVRHRANIRRLLNGAESKIGAGRSLR